MNMSNLLIIIIIIIRTDLFHSTDLEWDTKLLNFTMYD